MSPELTRRTPEERDACFAAKLIELQADLTFAQMAYQECLVERDALGAENTALRAVAEAAAVVAEEAPGNRAFIRKWQALRDALAALRATEAGSEP